MSHVCPSCSDNNLTDFGLTTTSDKAVLARALQLLAITIALLHVHVLACQDVLRREAMVLIRNGLVLRKYLLRGEPLQCTPSPSDW